MTTSINDTTDKPVVEITIERIITVLLAELRDADDRGTRYLAASRLYRKGYGDRFPKAIRAAARTGQIASRRVREGGGQRHRYLALSCNAGFLPQGGAR